VARRPPRGRAPAACPMPEPGRAERCDALVLGAGAAGIAAARELRCLGLDRVVVLEARAHVGGRANASDELGCGTALDHGAQWIHGHSRENPLSQLAEALGVETSRQADGFGVHVHCDGTSPRPADALAASRAFQKLKARVRRGLAASGAADCTWEEALRHAGCCGKGPSTAGAGGADIASLTSRRCSPQADASTRQQALLNTHIYFSCENYEGARLDAWSARNGDKTTCLDGPNADVDGGYGVLVARLAEGLDVRLSRRITTVEYAAAESEGIGKDDTAAVFVRCLVAGTDGEVVEEYCAPRCVVALPLGVLRSGSIRFDPPLPQRKAEAMSKLGLALMDKVELLWERRWWPRCAGSLRISSRESSSTYHPWPWFLEPKAARNHPLGWGVLVCFVTGRFAEELEAMDDESVVSRCVAALRRAFPDSCVPMPRAAHVTRWGREPCSLGSWTYYAKGSGPEDASSLAASIGAAGCVAFAGEHTCDGSQLGLDMGCVHGAWLSGLVAARSFESQDGRTSSTGNIDESVQMRRHRCEYRHRSDNVIPKIDGYIPGAWVQVTGDPAEIAEEFSVDPDERSNIVAAQGSCSKSGRIVARSQWGWLRVNFEDGTQSRWFTPFCLWLRSLSSLEEMET